jgi:hypothetical protein
VKEIPSYYAVIPANVRYDKRLSANAKLLYGEITALCNKKGYCWAGNQYFADLYGTTTSSVKRWIKGLNDAGYLVISYRYVEGTKEIQSRLIGIAENTEQRGGCKNEPTPTPESVDDALPGAPDGGEKDEKPDINEAKDESPAAKESGKPEAADGGGRKNEPTWGQKRAGAGSFLNEGGVKNAPDNITSNTKFIISSSPQIPPPQKEKPPPEKNEEDEEPNKNKDLRKMFLELNRAFIFDELFYISASQFLEDHDLPDDYLSWLYKLCEKQKPRNINSYYYKLFFSKQMLEIYKQQKKPPNAPGVKREACPVCGESVGGTEKICPSCRFEMSGKSDGAKVTEAREEHLRRSAEIQRLLEKNMDAAQLLKEVAATRKRSGA